MTSPIWLIILLNFTPKSLKFRSFRGLRPLGPPPRRCTGPTGGLKTAPSSMPLIKKNPRPPPYQNSWIRPCKVLFNTINKQTSSSHNVMSLITPRILVTLTNNIPGMHNALADTMFCKQQTNSLRQF